MRSKYFSQFLPECFPILLLHLLTASNAQDPWLAQPQTSPDFGSQVNGSCNREPHPAQEECGDASYSRAGDGVEVMA